MLIELLEGEKGEKGFLGFAKHVPPNPELAAEARRALAVMGVKAEADVPKKKGFFDRFRR